MKTRPPHPVTPDGRYFVVRGRLWRCSNPALPPAERQRWVDALMHARRAVGQALKGQAPVDLAAARAQVDVAKRALGERGPVWWTDGAPDWNRHAVHTTPYAAWHAEVQADTARAAEATATAMG
ncbi:MAG: hypothetical protein V4739_14070 [Pseudomonadota bacterium]